MRRGSGGLQLWLADLNSLGSVLDELERRERLLSPDDLRRADRFSALARAHEWRRSRIALRLLLARAGASDPRTSFAVGPHGGKPKLAENGPEFSISHTGGFALIGLGPAGPLGVDLEARRELRVAPQRERLLLAAGAALVGDTRAAADGGVVAAWVRLEALAKALGSGIGRMLTEIGIAGPASRARSPQVVVVRTARLVHDAGCRVWDLALPGQLVGAAALPPSIAARPDVLNLTPRECKLRAPRTGRGG